MSKTETTGRVTGSVTVCLPPHLRFLSPKAYSAARFCCACGDEVAGPEAAASVMCLYCGMEHGAVPMVEPETGADLPACFETRVVSLEALVQEMTHGG